VDFELEDLKGNKVRLSDFKGKVVFLNFWATWCPSCREEMPYKQEFMKSIRMKCNIVVS
jgi:thiol-disulfide isomerase/thioredoxin